MQARSTNTLGYVHFGHDRVAGGEEGSAVRLGPGSTGATAIIEPISDSDTAALTIQAKGTATVTLGNSSNAVAIVGSAITLTGAGLPIKAAYSTTFAYAYTALSSGAFEDLSIASTTADIQPGDLVSVSLAATTNALTIMNLRYSTAAASRVTVTVGNIASTAFGSTGSGTGRITWLDLT